MATIIPLSIRLKFQIRLSVLLTVEKLRFSRVRKYFWLRTIVLICVLILKIDSSSVDVCSGPAPCFCGSDARCSFSTCGQTSRQIVSVEDYEVLGL